MPARTRRPEKRDDIRTEAAFFGGVGVVMAAACYVVSAVSRLLDAEPRRPERSSVLSAASADD